MQRLLLAPLLLAACGILKLVPANGGGGDGPEGHHVAIEGRTYRVGPYWGPECERIGAYKHEVTPYDPEPEPTMGKQPNQSADPADQFLRLVCVERGGAAGGGPGRGAGGARRGRGGGRGGGHT